MFITRNLIIDVGFSDARTRMARIVDAGGLTEPSRVAYEGAITRLIRVGPLGDAPGVSKLVQVHFRGPAQRDAATTVWLRWEATGAAGGLFPALDADLMLTAEGAEKTRITLNGYYRPPLGRVGAGLDRAVLHRVASATIRALLRSVADALTEPQRASARQQEEAGSAQLSGPRTEPRTH